METAIHPSIIGSYGSLTTKPSFFSSFINWCEAQDKNRYGWLGVTVGSHGCFFTPLTLFAIILSGNNIVLWLIAIIAMMMTLVTNLAALPTKSTIPVFLLSILLDAAIFITCAFAGFDFSGTYS